MANNDHLPEPPIKTIASVSVYNNPWITVREDTITHPGGREGIYGYLESKDSVMVVAINSDGHIYLVKAYRYPSKSWGWELPGGSTDGEDPIVASQRELAEETGLHSDEWHTLGSPLVCNGLMSERMHVLLAMNVQQGNATDTEEEFLDQRFFSPEEIATMVADKQIDDGQTMTGLYLYQTWHKKGNT